jgi:predicted RNA-binding protein
VCDFNIVMIHGDTKEKIMSDVINIVVEGDSIKLSQIFGETKKIKGTIKEINVSRSEILVIPK